MRIQPTLRARRLAAVCGIVIQLGWLMRIFSGQSGIPDAVGVVISLATCAVAVGIVHFAQGPERQRSYAITIVKSALTWTVLWGLTGLIACVAMDAPLLGTAGITTGPLAGTVFGCLLALRSRTGLGSVPEVLVLGTIAGTLIAFPPVLQGFLDQGSFKDLLGIPITFAVLGGLGGVASFLAFARRRISLST